MTLFWMHLRKDIKKMTKIIFATGNEGKMREIRDIMADLDVELLSMKEAGIKLDIVEDGKTFEENALIKAGAVAKEAPGAIVMADDSGLEVDYLHKKPGIYSARFIGEDISYDIKNQAILDLLAGVPKEERTARFVCSIAAVLPDGRELVTRETKEGIYTTSVNEYTLDESPMAYKSLDDIIDVIKDSVEGLLQHKTEANQYHHY